MRPKRCHFSLYFPGYQGSLLRRVRSRLHPPPNSLVSVPRLRGAGAIQQEFSDLHGISGAIQPCKPNCFPQNLPKIPNRLKRRFCEFGFGEIIGFIRPFLQVNCGQCQVT
jgi:hypothetical protein